MAQFIIIECTNFHTLFHRHLLFFLSQKKKKIFYSFRLGNFFVYVCLSSSIMLIIIIMIIMECKEIKLQPRFEKQKKTEFLIFMPKRANVLQKYHVYLAKVNKH